MTKPFPPSRRTSGARRSVRMLLVLIPMLGLSCRTADLQREALADYYWEVQTLRLEASKTDSRAQALRDLGVIYLRTGHFEEAQEVLSSARMLERGDPKLWFYAGLIQELMGRKEAALTSYMQSPSLSTASIYSRAMRGRIAWLQEDATRQRLEALRAQASVSPDSLQPNVYAVLPLACEGNATYAVLGGGISDLLSRNLDRLQEVDTIDFSRIQEVLGMVPVGQEGAGNARVGQLLGAGNIVDGTCRIDENGQVAVELTVHNLRDGARVTVSGQKPVEQVFALEAGLVDDLIEALRLWVPGQARRAQVPPSTLAVLMAHSQGLAQEAAGQLERSAASYRAALKLDRRFIPADVRYEIVKEKLLTRVTDEDDYVALVVSLESDAAAPYLLEARRSRLGRSIDGGLMPGQRDRRLPPGNVGELPVPPRPTGN